MTMRYARPGGVAVGISHRKGQDSGEGMSVTIGTKASGATAGALSNENGGFTIRIGRGHYK